MAGRYKRGWTAIHQQVFKLRMIDGLAPREISEKTGIPIQRLNDMMRTKLFLEHEDTAIGTAVEKARTLLENKLIRAANKIVEIMERGKPEERLRYDAAKEILYQCGMKPVEVIETRGRTYTPEEIKSSLGVVKEIKEIEEKLSTQGSGFLIKRDDADASSSLPPSQLTQPEEIPLSSPQDEEKRGSPIEEVLVSV
jgi:hypothetical protein